MFEDGCARLVHDRPRPEATDTLVRVRTRIGGICNTDLELVRGYMGFAGVLGHEFVGEALDGPLAGRRVVGGINFACGVCDTCARGLGRHCPERTVLGIVGADGILADEFLIPMSNLVEVPDRVDDETAVFTEPVAAACEVLDQIAGVERGRALVLGAGKLGPLIAQVLAADGFEVTLVGRHLERLKWLADRGVRTSEKLGDKDCFPLVVEATGSTDGLVAAIAATLPRGTLVLKTTVAGSHAIDLAPIVINEITLLGSRCGRFAPALALLAEGLVETKHLIDARYGLGKTDVAFEHAARRGVRKVLVVAD